MSAPHIATLAQVVYGVGTSFDFSAAFPEAYSFTGKTVVFKARRHSKAPVLFEFVGGVAGDSLVLSVEPDSVSVLEDEATWDEVITGLNAYGYFAWSVSVIDADDITEYRFQGNARIEQDTGAFDGESLSIVATVTFQDITTTVSFAQVGPAGETGATGPEGLPGETYTHPNHSGDVTSSGDGATAIAAAAISGKTNKSSLAGTEQVLINDGGTLKKTTAQDIANLGGESEGDALTSGTLDQFADVTQSGGATLAINASTTLAGGSHSGTNTGDQDLSGYALTSHDHAGVYEPAKGADENYVTDAEKTVIGNTSGTNTGDQDLSGLQPLDAQLTDLASLSYAANALKVVRVNAGETAFELAAPAGSGDALVANNLDQFEDVAQSGGATLAITSSTTLEGGTHSGNNTGDQAWGSIGGTLSDQTDLQVELDDLNSAASAAATWGYMIGTLSDQTDLQAELDAKASSSHVHEGTEIQSTGETGGTKYLREDGDGTCSWQTISGGGDALVSGTLDQFANVTQTGGATLAISASTTLSGGTHSGTNTGDNAVNSLYSGLVTNATHTGDVTGDTALTIANDAVTFAKMQNISADHLIGRHSSGSGDPQQIGLSGGIELSGANLRRAELTGDVTAPAGDNALTIANGVVTEVKCNSSINASLDLADSSIQPGNAALTDERVPTASGLTSKFGTNKATIVDGDKIAILDSAATDAPKHSLFSVIKSTLKTYFDTLYAAALGVDDNYVTDAEKTVIGNTSGTNTGDQDLSGYVLTTAIDTLAELNAIVADATLIDTNDARLSDARTPTAHTHEGTAIQSTGETGGTKFLREDGDGTCSWQTVSGGDSYTHPNHSGDVTSTGDGATVIASSAISGKTEKTTITGGEELLLNDAGTVKKSTVNAIQTYLSLGIAENLATKADQNQALDLFGAPSDNTTLDATASAHGLMPKASYVKLDALPDAATLTSALAGKASSSHAHEGTAILSTGETGGTKFLREDGDGTCSWQTIAGGGDALVGNPLSQFAATTSSQLAGVMSDETGTGALVFATSPTLVTPALGTPASGVLTNCTGLPEAGLADDAVTLAKMASGTAGNLITYDASGNPAAVETGTATHVLTSNGAGAAPTFQAAAGGGLTNFTETLLTASPNNTVNAARIAVTGGTTNTDLVLSPKGNGAIILGKVPDSTAVGGNKRGQYAVDIQGYRSAATEVANYESVAIGNRCTASGFWSIAIGLNSTASATSSISVGNSVGTASGSASTILGGTSNAASGTGSGIFSGYICNASGESSIASGRQARADRYNIQSHGTDGFGQGSAQAIRAVLSVRTTNATETELWLNNSNIRLTIPSGKILSAIVNVVGSKSDGTAVARYTRQVTIKNLAGTTSLVGSVETIGVDVAEGTALAISANDTNDAIKIAVTGIASETWRWVAVVNGVELIYGA